MVVVGVVGAVLVAVFFVHARHVRLAAANKRSRGSSQQRALDSFFRQNRVTVPRETSNFVSDPLTPRDEIAVTIPSNNQNRPDTVAAAQAFRRARPDSNGSIATPTESFHTSEYDSFTGQHQAASATSSSAYGSASEFSESSSLGSIAPSVISSQRSAHQPGFQPRLGSVASSQARSSKRASSATSIGDVRYTDRSDRSSGDFSVFNASASVDEDSVYRMSTQLLDVSALPERSEPRGSYDSDALSDFSVDDSYGSRSTDHSYATGRRTDNSFATNLSVDDRDTASGFSSRDSDSLVLRASKDSELSEGEI
ncbi:unnamed protein product [Phytophthora fragariaefolia]|uniref:Unnamed protein product n=1 Tax=Phytophthora fragariaefolia TaxID=1490495 RepID=A0A9W6WY21_9STRA|nr:unnamed protein product [Phytophthora fragariaefolia]